MKAIERLYEYIDFKGYKPTKLEKEIGLSSGYLSVQKKRKADMGETVVNKINDYCHDLNIEWLLTGKGEMLKSESSDHIAINFGLSQSENTFPLYLPKSSDKRIDIQQIPLYDIETSAGLSMLFTNQSTQVPVGFITMPDAPKCNGAIPIRGDSMYPLLKSGDIACYKHLNSLENIQWGEIYIIYIDADGDEMFVTKYVQKSELGDDYISLVSYNKHHQPQDILKKHIKAMAMMKISIRYNTNV